MTLGLRRLPILGAAPYAALIVAVLAWGLSNVATRYLLMSLRPLDVVTLRYSIAACLFAPLLVRLGYAVLAYNMNTYEVEAPAHPSEKALPVDR